MHNSLEVIVSTAKEESVFGLFRTLFFHIQTEYGELVELQIQTLFAQCSLP